MSLDFQIAHQCPHLTVEEVVQLGADRRTLSTLQPVASANVVRIQVNDELLIPQGGLFTAAQVYSSVSGPYDLAPGSNTLVVKTSQGTQTVSFSVTTKVRWTTDKIIAQLMQVGFSVALAENVNGHLVFSDAETLGYESQVRVSGNAAQALGFGDPTCGSSAQFGARGTMLYPPWQLVTRPDTITNRYPQFVYPIRNNPVLKVTYAVPVNRCRRCRATYIENDYRFDTAGQGILIGNENLLYQSALKILLTDRGSNPYHPWYGTTIRSRIGSKAIGSVSSVLSEDVRTALANLQSVQKEQGKYQPTTLKERLYQVLDVRVSPHVEDPTTYLIDVVVQNQSSEPIGLSIVFTVPGVVALMGSNMLTLGTEIAGIDPKQLPYKVS